MVQEGFENFLAAEKKGRGSSVFDGTLRRVGIDAFAHALYHKPIHFLVRPIKNLRVDALVSRYRGLCGNRAIEKNESARAVLRVLREGGHGRHSCGSEHDAGGSCVRQFFRHSRGDDGRAGAAGAPHWCGCVAGAQLLGCVAGEIPVAVRAGAGVDRPATTRKPIFGRIRRCLIRCWRVSSGKFPDQWFWVHRRWKNRPEGEAPVYADGKT